MAMQKSNIPTLLRIFIACAALMATCTELLAQPVPLNSAVLIYDEKTLIGAPDVVQRIADLGDERLMFVVTVHCRLSPDFKPTELGLMGDRYRSWRDDSNFKPMDEELQAFYQKHLTAAFQKAVDLNLDIAVLPHYDPAGKIVEWRNRFDFDPLEEVSGFSYYSTLIEPCIQAFEATAKETTKIDFSLGGEMGHSAFAYPASYRELAQRVRSRLHDKQVRVGISLNHGTVADNYQASLAQRTEMQAFLSECDFVGFSNYSPFKLPPSAEQFSMACQKFVKELGRNGVELPQAIPLHFSEIGLGGAPNARGDSATQAAAAEPWEGTVRVRNNPWVSEGMIEMRREYHAALLEFLQNQPGPRRVEAAYFWSEGSWEPLGVAQQVFVDAKIAESIREHNKQVRKGL